MPSFYALIQTIDVPQGPPGWDTFPKPMPQPPLGTWGGAGQPFPTPPMAPGGGGHWGQANDPGYGIPERPLGTWGGGNVPYPTPPIFYPQPPLGTWGGGGERFPTNPIVIPPNLPGTLPPPDSRPIEWKTAWTQMTGWVVVGIPTGPAPTPSSAPQQGTPQAPQPPR
jgi:hypothetical protein